MKVLEYYRASSLEDAYQKLQEDSKNVILAGGLWIKKMGQSINTLIDLSTLGLNQISETEEEVVVGALTTQRDFENSEIVKSLFDAGAVSTSVRRFQPRRASASMSCLKRCCSRPRCSTSRPTPTVRQQVPSSSRHSTRAAAMSLPSSSATVR